MGSCPCMNGYHSWWAGGTLHDTNTFCMCMCVCVWKCECRGVKTWVNTTRKALQKCMNSSLRWYFYQWGITLSVLSGTFGTSSNVPPLRLLMWPAAVACLVPRHKGTKWPVKLSHQQRWADGIFGSSILTHFCLSWRVSDRWQQGSEWKRKQMSSCFKISTLKEKVLWGEFHKLF